MKCFRFNRLNVALLVVVLSVAGCSSGSLQSRQSARPAPMTEEEFNKSLPADVFTDSGNRLPVVNREELDEERKLIFDERKSPNTVTRAGLRGPSGIRLHGSPSLEESRVDLRTQELARLVVSREMNQGFEWTLHEPLALKSGLAPEIIDVIRYRKPLDGVPDREASIIQMGREIFQDHKLSSETFARVVKHLGRRDFVDLCDFMGNYVKTAILLHAVDAHLPYNREDLLPVP